MAEDKFYPSPGNACSSNSLQMSIPHLEFIYRLECEMAKDNHAVGAPFGGTDFKMIMPIVGGIVKGPQINGTIEPMSGADWGTMVRGTDFMRLNARYTLKTHDGHFIYVRSKGVFAPRTEDLPARGGPPRTISQSQVDWFTRLQFDTGPGPYSWMNGMFAIGVLSMHEGRINIDAYRVTNAPGEAVRDVKAKI